MRFNEVYFTLVQFSLVWFVWFGLVRVMVESVRVRIGWSALTCIALCGLLLLLLLFRWFSYNAPFLDRTRSPEASGSSSTVSPVQGKKDKTSK